MAGHGVLDRGRMGRGGMRDVFYGREHDQEERKAADRLGVPHAELWEELPKAAPCLWPSNWGRGNRWDFYAPCLAVLVVAGGVTIGGVL